ncbi:MAG: hypothetical protein JO042_06640 [Sinobacteraceae bacterium]|nr:hypothetical protein [Nevskiaceae bacterium]
MKGSILAAAGVTLALALCSELGVEARTAACDRLCLEGFVDEYFEAMKFHHPERVPGASGARYTENGVEIPAGQGLWGTFSDLGSYRIYATDPQTAQAAFVGTIRENGTPAILALRLRVVDGKLSEAEAIVHRAAADAGALESRGQPDAIWSQPVKAGIEPPHREQLVRAARLYFRGILAAHGQLVPFSEDCNRIIDGVQDTNNAADRGFLFGTYNPAGLSCPDNLSSGVWAYIESIQPQRYPLVDEEKGIVFAVLMFNHPGNITSAYARGYGRVPMPSVVLRPSTVEIADFFKIEGGQIKRIEAVTTALPYMHPDGWSGKAGSANDRSFRP